MTIWEKVAIDDLRRFGHLENANKDLAAEIKDIEAELYTLSAPENTPVKATGNKTEDKYSNSLVRREMLENQVKINQRDRQRIGAALDRLDETDRWLLEITYIHRRKNHINIIMAKQHIEMAAAYKNIKKALQKYCRARYGA